MHYLASMFTDLWVLSQRLEVGYIYPFIALSFVFVPIGATTFFGEPLPAGQLLGIALMMAGVTVSALAR